MTHKPVFQLLVELHNSKNSSLPEEFSGAWVYVYLSAQDISSAITTAQQRITTDGYALAQITMAALVELSEYETEEGHPDIDALNMLSQSEDMLYSVFYGYESTDLSH